jgi:hypothetical protein
VRSKFLYLCASAFTLASLTGSVLSHADSLNIETNYRLRGIDYTNNDFNNNTSTDSRSYYSQRLQLTIKGNVSPNIEIGSKITALGVVGSTSVIFGVPYQKTDLTPFIENAYIRLNKIGDAPVDVIIGKQSLDYGDGLIVGDNGIGYNALRIRGYYDVPFDWEAEAFTAKITENFLPSSDQDLNGLVGAFTWQKHLWQIAYFMEQDNSGTLYTRGATSYPTTAIAKNFLDLRLGKSEKLSSYQFEIAKENGYINLLNRPSLNIDGLAFTARGELIGEKTKIGKVNAHALLSVLSGNSNPTLLTDDNSFKPTFTRQFDGLERAGYGKLFAAVPGGSFFTLPDVYSGVDTLSLGATFSPLYGWSFGVDYFLYSASQGPEGAPVASGFERLFGAQFSLGVEMDLSVKYEQSKYISASFIFSRYTPPNAIYWPTQEPAAMYELEFTGKF